MGRSLRPKCFPGIFINEPDIFQRVFLVRRQHNLWRLRFVSKWMLGFAVAGATQSPTALHLRVNVPFLGLPLFPCKWLGFLLGSLRLVLCDIAVAYRLLNINLALLPIERSSPVITFLAKAVKQLFLGRR